MIERKSYKNVDMGVSFLSRFIDRCAGWIEEAPLTKLNVLYFELLQSMLTDNGPKGFRERYLMELKFTLEHLKRSFVKTFSDHCNLRSYTLKYRLLDDIVKDGWAVGILSVLNASHLEQCNVNHKYVYRHTSRRRNPCMNKTVLMVGCTVNWTQTGLDLLSLEGEEKRKMQGRSTAETGEILCV